MRISDLLKGWNFAPRLVAIVRGALEAAALAGLAYLGMNAEELATFLPEIPNIGVEGLTGVAIIGWVIRWLEGEADQYIDPQANRTAERRAANPPE